MIILKIYEILIITLLIIANVSSLIFVISVIVDEVTPITTWIPVDKKNKLFYNISRFSWLSVATLTLLGVIAAVILG